MLAMQFRRSSAQRLQVGAAWRQGLGKRVNASEKRGPPASPTPHFTLNILGQGIHDSPFAEGWIQGRPCRVTMDTSASVTIARPDIVAGQPDGKPSRAYILQTASGDTITVLKEALIELSLGQRALRFWVFITEITDEFILGIDVLWAYDVSVDLGRHLLHLG